MAQGENVSWGKRPREKMTQLRFWDHRVTYNLPIGYFSVPYQNMQVNAKYAKFSLFIKNGKAQFSFSESHL